MWPIRITGNDGIVLVDGEAEGSPAGVATVFQQPTDPGAVGAGALWVNTTGITGTSDLPLLVRNAGDTAWEPVGLAHYDGTGQLRGFVTMTDTAIVVEKKDAAGITQALLLLADDHIYLSGNAQPIWLSGAGLGGTEWGLSSPSGAEKFSGLLNPPADAEVGDGQKIIWLDGATGYSLFKVSPTGSGTVTAGMIAGLSDTGAQFLQGALIEWVTVQATPPAGPYQTPLVQDTTPVTGGLYGWDGAAYQMIAPVV